MGSSLPRASPGRCSKEDLSHSSTQTQPQQAEEATPWQGSRGEGSDAVDPARAGAQSRLRVPLERAELPLMAQKATVLRQPQQERLLPEGTPKVVPPPIRQTQ